MDRRLTLLNTAIAHYGAGRPADAVAVLQTVLVIDPALADGLRLLGIGAAMQGEHLGAVRALGHAVRAAGHRCAPLLPDLAVALGNKATVLARSGAAAEAMELCRHALALAPGHRDALTNLANLTTAPDAAATLWRRAALLAPDQGDAWKGLGVARLAARRTEDAVHALKRAAATAPDAWETCLLLGNAALADGDVSGAASCYDHAHRLSANHGAASNLAVVLANRGQADAALGAARRSAALCPDSADIWINFGSVLTTLGDPGAAVPINRRILALRPGSTEGHSNLLMALQYLDGLSPLDLLAEHRRFDALHGRPRAAHHDRHVNDSAPDRPLRVGYVSSDFRQHVASCFFEPLLACHDPAAVETVCYSDTAVPDAVTRRLIALSGAWRDTVGMAEGDLDCLIRADRIDILVDLTGHSSGNRQPVFARRPAPIQVTWLGYPDTSGLSAMDYRLVDAITDPPGPADGLASETLARLPGGFLCYWPPRGIPGLAEDGAEEPRPVTFGSFNRLAKMTPSVLALWATVLTRAPDARLLIKANGLASAATRDRLLGAFREHGVEASRLDLLSWSPTWLDHLELYRRIDIALDSFPYNGTTTTCEALWMGVPTIGLLGDRHAARVGASLLSRIGLGDLVARSPAEYVDIAAELAGDRARLAALRGGLRDRLRASPLCDGPGFAHAVETAYRTMWRRWCAGRNGTAP